jgi:hypothetical protein
MAFYAVNEAAVAQARRLIRGRHYVLNVRRHEMNRCAVPHLFSARVDIGCIETAIWRGSPVQGSRSADPVVTSADAFDVANAIESAVDVGDVEAGPAGDEVALTVLGVELVVAIAAAEDVAPAVAG